MCKSPQRTKGKGQTTCTRPCPAIQLTESDEVVEIGRLAGLQRERPQERSIQLQCGPPTEVWRTTRPLCLRPQESGEKEHSGGAAPTGKQHKGRGKASKQRESRKTEREGGEDAEEEREGEREG